MNAPNNFQDRRGGASHLPDPELVDVALRIGFWFALCLFLASMAPSWMIAAVLRDLLMLAAMASGITAMLRGVGPWQDRLNDFDVAASLLFLALLSGLFIDHDALQAAAQGAGAAAPQTP